VTLHLDRPAWQQQAACHGMTALFFPTRGQDVKHVRHICAACPVRTECLDFALDNGIQHGIFVGTSERERRTMRRVRTFGTPIAMRSDERRPCDRDGCTFVALGAPAMAAHVRAHRRADDFAAQRSPLGGVA